MAIGDRPSAFPRWAYDDGADAEAAGVLEPSDGRKDTGATSGNQLTAQELNWALTKAYQWLKYYDAERIKPRSFLGALGGVAGTGQTKINAGDGSIEASNAIIVVPLTLPVGLKIDQIDIEVDHAGGASCTYHLYEEDNAGGGRSSVASATDGTAGRNTVSLTSLAKTIAADKTYYIWADDDLSAGTHKIYMVYVTPTT